MQFSAGPTPPSAAFSHLGLPISVPLLPWTFLSSFVVFFAVIFVLVVVDIINLFCCKIVLDFLKIVFETFIHLAMILKF